MYAFSSWAALEAFSSSPQAFQDSVRAQLSRTPLLVPLLGQQAGFPLLDLAALFQIMSAAPVKSSFGTQTPTHFVEKHIEANYEWNQWALRRRAIHMANLRSKATHSAQTLLSHFRRDGAVQVCVGLLQPWVDSLMPSWEQQSFGYGNMALLFAIGITCKTATMQSPWLPTGGETAVINNCIQVNSCLASLVCLLERVTCHQSLPGTCHDFLLNMPGCAAVELLMGQCLAGWIDVILASTLLQLEMQ